MEKLSRIKPAADKQHGFSLIEVMISLALSSVLIGGVFTTYLNSKQTERFAQALSRLQESARFSVNYLAKEIRMVGYRGCVSFDDVMLNVIAKAAPDGANLFQNELLGFEANSSSWASGTQYELGAGSYAISPRLHTDVISIRRSSTIDSISNGNVSATATKIKIDVAAGSDLVAGNLLMASDCTNGDLFAATTVTKGGRTTTIVHAANLNNGPTLSKLYDGQATIYKFSSISYFVDDTGRVNSRGEPIYALYQASDGFDNSFSREEVIEGVENMQILYGVRNANGNLKYVKATAVTAAEWPNVTSIQIALLLTSNDNVRQSPDSSTYELPGASISATGTTEKHEQDKRLRQVYTTNIVLRNRQ